MDTIKLKVVEDYVNKDLRYGAGSVIDVPEVLGLWLMRDAPGCFERIAPAVPSEKAITAAPADKMQRRARTK